MIPFKMLRLLIKKLIENNINYIMEENNIMRSHLSYWVEIVA
jgi:hypothetical protein